MDLELWWLLPIPALFFAFGWVAARIDIKHLLRESRTLPASYFRGLNFLLEEQPDKAIESFVEVVKVDPGTSELHFALGRLFRRQGEVERAIRMHQLLLDRHDIPADKRIQATFELAQDFHRAGLLDRAEELFGKLAGTPYEHEALGFLLQIYEQEKDWRQAIATTRRMEKLAMQPYPKEIAQYHCELAAEAMLHGRYDEARAHLGDAVAEHKLCVRATLIAGDIAAAQDDIAAAVNAWQRIESQNPPFLALVADRLADGYARLGDPEQGRRVLASYLERYPSLDLMNTAYRVTLAARGLEAAEQLIRDELRRHPTLPGLDKLLEAELLAAPPERRHDIELVKGLIAQHTRRLGMYRCDHCGFRARTYYWRCPGCGKWETYPPRRTEIPDGHG
jgi:lipopolysaccharide biosynthesis regulator YciM